MAGKELVVPDGVSPRVAHFLTRIAQNPDLLTVDFTMVTPLGMNTIPPKLREYMEPHAESIVNDPVITGLTRQYIASLPKQDEIYAGTQEHTLSNEETEIFRQFLVANSMFEEAPGWIEMISTRMVG